MPDAVTPPSVATKTAKKKTAAGAGAYKHLYHAEAKALQGAFVMPLNQAINPPHAFANLHPSGGYLAQRAGEYRLESVLSYASARTQVAGVEGTRDCPGHATLATVVVEDLNILEVVTCDRIVAQISTLHPLVGHTPEIVFLGTRYENLRIAGYPLAVTLDIGIAGPKPAHDLHYFREPAFLERVSKQCADLRSHKKLPPLARKRYTGDIKPATHEESIEFSLVSGITGITPGFPGEVFGHVIRIPHFGTLYLATVKITCEDDNHHPPATTVELKMLELNLGCIAHGSGDVAFAKTNVGPPGG